MKLAQFNSFKTKSNAYRTLPVIALDINFKVISAGIPAEIPAENILPAGIYLCPAGNFCRNSCRKKFFLQEFLQEKRFLQEFLQKFLQEENFQNEYS